MYRLSYAETLSQNPRHVRAMEREVLKGLATRLRQGELAGPGSKDAIVALALLNATWSALLSDLASDENDLPLDVRAKLISIGISVLRESEEIRLGRSSKMDFLREMTDIVADGLS